MYTRLNDHVTSMVVSQKPAAGIGPRTWVRYYNANGRMILEEEITDLGVW
jgi:hypothetical protein